ncbi:MAG: L-rhamnose/proton symporter RhaT [Bryobacteraceae bacterium]
MPEILSSGITIVLLAGVFQGSCLVYAKWMRGWAWENYWLVFATFAYLISPWVLAFATVPHLAEVYSGVSLVLLLWVAMSGVGWGLGALTFGLGVEAVGLALAYAVILGVSATAGTAIPLLFAPAGAVSWSVGWFTAVALALMLVGVAVCAVAGKWKDQSGGSTPGRSYKRGLLICIASGLLSACGNFGFTFGADIAQRARALGAADEYAGNAVWALMMVPMFLCNAAYTTRLLKRNHTSPQFKTSPGWNTFLGLIMGVSWFAGMAVYGTGARKLGDLGTSLGWALLVSSMVLVANALGILTGEWTSAPRRSRWQLAAGLGILLLAIAVLGYANHLRAA